MTGSGRTRSTTAATSVATRERVPEQVVAARLRLERQRLDGAAPGRREEAAQRLVLAGRLVLRPDHPGVRAAAELEVHPLEAEPPHDASVAGPVATTTRSPAACHAVASVASG